VSSVVQTDYASYSAVQFASVVNGDFFGFITGRTSADKLQQHLLPEIHDSSTTRTILLY